MTGIIERVARFLAAPTEKPERLTAAEYLKWFERDRMRRSEGAERYVHGVWGTMPTGRSIAIMENMIEKSREMKADPVALRDQAERDEIIITD